MIHDLELAFIYISTRQGSIWDYGDPTLRPGTLPKKPTSVASNSGGGSAECPRLSVNIGGARSREVINLYCLIDTEGYM